MMPLPKIRLNSISINKFKIFDHVRFDFTDKNFACLIGPNGTGKSTLLEIIQMLFYKYEEYTPQRLQIMLENCIRRTNGKVKSGNFKINAEFSMEHEGVKSTYNVIIDKSGVLNGHPQVVYDNLYKICYYSTFDKELNKFQLCRSKWKQFNVLMEAVTGYPIFEVENKMSNFAAFSGLENYIVDFYMKKTHESVKHKDMSDGEKKIVKCFSTILNSDEHPSIILIDNVEMHVELKRHLPLIKELISTFPNSQIISTTHSHRVSRTLKERTAIYDLRLINANEIISKEPQRLYMIDEVDDLISRNGCVTAENNKKLARLNHKKAIKLREKLLQSPRILPLTKELVYLSEEINRLFLYDIALPQTNGLITNLKNSRFSKNKKK